MDERLITIAEAARETGLVYYTLRRLVVRGAIPSVMVAGGVRRVRLSAVRACFQECVAVA
jgi:excisionase family DNA binding protein